MGFQQRPSDFIDSCTFTIKATAKVVFWAALKSVEVVFDFSNLVLRGIGDCSEKEERCEKCGQKHSRNFMDK